MSDFVLRGATLVFPDRDPERGDVLVINGRIEALLEPGATAPAGIAEQRAEGLHAFPGCIDAHVHFGMGEKITEYSTETVYAAQGGITTILGYFLNNEAYSEVFRREQEYARSRMHVDYGFHFSTANELHIEELDRYVRDYGVTSFKYFMNFKGEEGRYLGLDGTDDGFFHDLLKRSAEVGRPMIVCHTENIEIVNRLRQRVQASGGSTLRDWASCKPALTEAEPAIRAMFLAEKLGARVFFPHISTRMTLDEVRFWRGRFDQVFVETCPHYLTHTEDSDLAGMGKANPPFHTADDREALWEGIADGTIDVVASDHVARKRATKDKSMWLASQGFPGSATILPVLLSEGWHKRRIPLRKLAATVTSGPARIFDLAPVKGSLARGADADFTLVDLERERTVRADELGSYSDYSLYDGWTFKGWPVRTIVRGVTVMDEGRITGAGGHGEYLWRRIGEPPVRGRSA
ncbi:MAG: dihydroorotase [Burkholderiaceae bacterium]|jgi:dihydropyrimidinase